MIILFVIYIFLGIGFGMLNSPITITAIEGMPLSQSGTAAAIAVTCKALVRLLEHLLQTYGFYLMLRHCDYLLSYLSILR